MAPIIEVNSVTKKFLIGKERFDSLKDRVVHVGRTHPQEFWALKGVDLEIGQGETFGLLGHNGSGKSTLLKCVAGIMPPTSGNIVTRGRISALLELGAGMHPDLTGRENVELNGLLLGLTRREIARRFDEIVGFAGEQVQEAIDRQVKFYSSGMYVRLGFAVAVSVEPEILLVDEVLAVGDEFFARKCMAKIKQFQREGRTIVFVTHGPEAVREICDRAMVLDHGNQVTIDEPGPAIRTYRDHLYASGRADEAIHLSELGEGIDQAADPVSIAKANAGRRVVEITGVRVVHSHQAERANLLPGEACTIEVEYEAREPHDVMIGIALFNERGEHLYGTNTHMSGNDLIGVFGPGTVRFVMSSVPLLDGNYFLQVGLTELDGEVIDWIDSQPGFAVGQVDKAVGQVAIPTSIEHVPGPRVARSSRSA
jgi:ABC-2 type transport system ATP-binding protein